MNDNPKSKDNSPTKRDAKIDKIIKRITNSPKKTTTEQEMDQIIKIIPASTSTPVGTNNKYTPQRDTDQKTTKTNWHRQHHRTNSNTIKRQNTTTSTNNQGLSRPTRRTSRHKHRERQYTHGGTGRRLLNNEFYIVIKYGGYGSPQQDFWLKAKIKRRGEVWWRIHPENL